MTTYVDEFDTLFAHLDRMGDDVKIPDAHTSPIVSANMGNNSPPESTIGALRTKDNNKLTWQYVTSDIIQEYNQIKGRQKLLSNSNVGDDKSSHGLHTRNGNGKGKRKYDFCWKPGQNTSQ